MNTLYVLYDQSCGMCCAAVERLRSEPAYLVLRFVPRTSPMAIERFGEFIDANRPDEIVAVADSGEVYQGEAAWIMVLYALRRYRALSMTLAAPVWRPWVKRAISIISARRHRLSALLGFRPDTDVFWTMQRLGTPGNQACADGSCSVRAEATTPK